MLAQRGGGRFGYVVVPKCEGGRPKTRLYAMSDETSRPSASPGSIRCGRALKAAVSCEVFHANGLASRRVLAPRASAGAPQAAIFRDCVLSATLVIRFSQKSVETKLRTQIFQRWRWRGAYL